MLFTYQSLFFFFSSSCSACYYGHLDVACYLVETTGAESLQKENLFSETPFHRY